MAINTIEKHVSLKDIQQRLKNNPEPPEVTEIRNKILTSFNDLRFDPIPHKYYLPDGEGNEKEIISVSGFVKSFENETNWEEVLQRKALKLGVDPEDLREQWLYNNHLATTGGTVHHAYGESLANLMYTGDPETIVPEIKQQFEEGYIFPSATKQFASRDALEYIFSNPNIYVVLTETRVYTTLYAGTFDLLVYYKHPTDPSKSGLKILDYKTNASLYNSYAQSTDKMMKAPFSHFVDEDYSHYVIQQSAYQIPLEDLGFNVLSRTLIHLKDNGGVPEYEFVTLPDVTKEIRAML